MMKLLALITKRPKDSTILYSLVFLGLLLIGSLYYNLIYQGDALETQFFWQELSTNTVQIIKYLFVGMGIIPLYLGLTKQCILKKKHMRMFQVFFGIILLYMSSKIVDGPKLDVDALLFLLAFPPIIAGITGKCISSKCMKYREKIKKIRV